MQDQRDYQMASRMMKVAGLPPWLCASLQMQRKEAGWRPGQETVRESGRRSQKGRQGQTARALFGLEFLDTREVWKGFKQRPSTSGLGDNRDGNDGWKGRAQLQVPRESQGGWVTTVCP